VDHPRLKHKLEQPPILNTIAGPGPRVLVRGWHIVTGAILTQQQATHALPVALTFPLICVASMLAANGTNNMLFVVKTLLLTRQVTSQRLVAPVLNTPALRTLALVAPALNTPALNTPALNILVLVTLVIPVPTVLDIPVLTLGLDIVVLKTSKVGENIQQQTAGITPVRLTATAGNQTALGSFGCRPSMAGLPERLEKHMKVTRAFLNACRVRWRKTKTPA